MSRRIRGSKAVGVLKMASTCVRPIFFFFLTIKLGNSRKVFFNIKNTNDLREEGIAGDEFLARVLLQSAAARVCRGE